MRLQKGTHLGALLGSLLEVGAGYGGRTKEAVRGAVDVHEARPTEDLCKLLEMNAPTDRGRLTEPVQNWGQAPLRAVPAPWGNHAERYGERTASG